MVCRQCCGIEQVFSEGEARRELRTFHRKGASRSTRLLISALKNEGVRGQELLDIGGGIGAIQQELIPAGIRHVVNVDAASGHIMVSREEAERNGFADQVDYLYGDFVDKADEMEGADIVTLDRVICCYPDMHSLVSQSAGKAQRLYGFVVPRDTWWTKLAVKIFNMSFPFISRTGFRTFIHPIKTIESLLIEQGFERIFRRTAGVWQVMLFRRSENPGADTSFAV